MAGEKEHALTLRSDSLTAGVGQRRWLADDLEHLREVAVEHA
jgi:hypothetical protein